MMTLDRLELEVSPVLDFINQKWDDLRANARHGHEDHFGDWAALAANSTDGHLDDLDPANPYILFLPNDFITPGGRFMVQFYWDSYFIILSLLLGNRIVLAKGVVENCLFLVKRHGMVIANRKRWAAGSQLPFLSEMVREVYLVTQDKSWLTSSLPIIEAEYRDYWLNADHLAYRGLSRYHAPSCYPKGSIAEITLDHEASWDLSPRFDVSDVLHLLPVDLNSNLYTYEKNFAYFNRELGRQGAANQWEASAQERARVMEELMWDEKEGLYFDYNFHSGERKKVRSLASFFPLFSRISSIDRAEKVCSKLPDFEHRFGLSACDQNYGYTDRQWNYPVGWAPLHWVAYRALNEYGFTDTATRIALKWLDLNINIWKTTGKLYEKYDVVNGNVDVLTDRYKNQEGFGWTNAIVHCLAASLLGTTGPARRNFPGDT